MSHNKALDALSREQLIELLEIYSKNWLAADGIWTRPCTTMWKSGKSLRWWRRKS